MRSTTYQCDRCRDVLIQGLALGARHFTTEGVSLPFDKVLAPYAEELNFCDIDCLLTFVRGRMNRQEN